MKKLIALIIITLTLTACGKAPSERSSGDCTKNFVTGRLFKVLSVEDGYYKAVEFTDMCSQEGPNGGDQVVYQSSCLATQIKWNLPIDGTHFQPIGCPKEIPYGT